MLGGKTWGLFGLLVQTDRDSVEVIEQVGFSFRFLNWIDASETVFWRDLNSFNNFPFSDIHLTLQVAFPILVLVDNCPQSG